MAVATKRLAGRGRSVLRAVLLIAVPIGLAIAAFHFYAQGGRHVETDNAYVKAHIIAVSTDVAGRVVQVAVRDNEAVVAGQLLFRVEPKPFDVAIARADAQMALARTEIESLRADYRVSLAEAAEAEERIGFLARQLDRQQRLKDHGMSREDALDEARNNLKTARAHLAAARERTARILVNLGGRLDIPVTRHPRFLEAQAARSAAALDLANTRISAPAIGVVSNMRLQAGEFVARGVPVFSLIETTTPWIEANFKETQLAAVHTGQPVRVVADAYPGVEWSARVQAIAPATGAEFALLPPQNATGNWVKVVQRVPVHIAIEPTPDAPPLRAGMTVTVSIDTGRSRGLPAFLSWLTP